VPEPAIGAAQQVLATLEMPIQDDLHKAFGGVSAIAQRRIPANTVDDLLNLRNIERRGTALGFVLGAKSSQDRLGRHTAPLEHPSEPSEMIVALPSRNLTRRFGLSIVPR
jgi:hypothetical protein